jgi:uncharacterized protein YkwD
MRVKHWMGAVLIVGLGVPTAAHGQFIEADDAEAVKSSVARKAQEEAADLSRPAQRVIERTNAFRREERQAEVQVNPQLTEAARYFAQYMAGSDRYGHTADGRRPAERAGKHGYEHCIISENIAYQYTSEEFTTEQLAEGFFQGWKDSPGHRKNMLDPDVTETGVAIAQSKDSGYYYAVQMFGRPASERIEFRITNRSDATVEYQVGDRTFPLPPGYTRTHQQCRPPQVALRLANNDRPKEELRTLRPRAGDHYSVSRENSGEVVIRKE